MKPSDRLSLIQRICDRLEELDWSDLHLTLRQFGVPSNEGWNGEKHSYCITQVEKGDDNTLLDLYEHFYGKPFEPGLRPAPPGRWREGYLRLFLSHVSAYKVVVADVKANLAPFGVDGFVAHEDIEPTAEWVGEIEAALDTCDVLAAFLTPEFPSSKWADQEIGFCLKRRVLILPIRLGIDPIMTEAAKDLLLRFESLPLEDRREVAAEILRRRRRLEEVLDHAGRVELNVDGKELRRLRETG